MKKKYLWSVRVEAKGTDALEIAVYDIIGKSFFGDGVSSKDVLGALRKSPQAKDISLRINSVGGVVDDAKAMGNLLNERKASGATVTAYIDGIAASAASYLATFADRVVMPSNSFQMLHQARAGVAGNADQFRNAASVLDRTNDQLIEGYVAASARRGKDKTADDYKKAFAKGDLYLTAKEAVEWGLADEESEPVKAVACLVEVTDLGEVPEELRAAPYVTAANSQSSDVSNVDPPGSTARVGDLVAAATNPAAVSDGAKGKTKKMTLAELKAQHPDLYAAAFAEGEKGERDRVVAHLTMGDASGDMKTAVDAINSGAVMTMALNAKYLAAGMNRADRTARQTETTEAASVTAGAASASAAAAAAGEPDLGDKIVAVIDAKSGKKAS